MSMQRFDVARKEDHQWQSAVAVANGQTDITAVSDPLVLATVNFIKQFNQPRTPQAQAKCRRKFPSISLAHQIRFDPQEGRRDALEAMLLAGCAPKTVAEVCSLELAVVWIYIELFFDVLDRLHAPDFISSQILGLHRTDLDEQEHQRRAKLWLAWLRGPSIIPSLLFPGYGVGDADEQSAVGDWWMDFSLKLLDRETGLASLLGQLDGEQLRQLSRYRVRAREQREAGQGSQAQQDFCRNIETFLAGIELTVGAKGIPNGAERKYYTSAVEPRADEWDAIARGEEVPELDQALPDTSLLSRMQGDRAGKEHDQDQSQEGHND